MRAIVCTAYGPPDVLELQELEKPVPKDDEVLVKVFASTVSIGDCRVRSWNVPALFWILYRIQVGLTRPKRGILGAVLAGEVQAVGKDVTRFQIGDQVYGMDVAGIQGNAQYACRAEGGALAAKPANLTYELAAAVPHGAMTARFFLRDKANVQPGHKGLINGASGAVGSWAVQLAKHYGAEVTGVCRTASLDLVKALGADRVIDYTREDFTASGETYDIIFDAVAKSSFSRCEDSLEDDGVYLATDPTLAVVLSMVWTSIRGGKRALWAIGPERPQDLEALREILEAGEAKPTIDRRYPLEKVAEAHSYVEEGHTKGVVVINVEHHEGGNP